MSKIERLYKPKKYEAIELYHHPFCCLKNSSILNLKKIFN